MERLIAGVDEAGRGPLAGPVVAAAVILPERHGIAGLDDSKKLSPARRRALEVEIRKVAVFAIAEVDNWVIDRINILQATMRAMAVAVRGLSTPPDHILVDGNRLPDCPWPAEAVVGGDALHACISAASILAKEHRDRLMTDAAGRWPRYGWERNKGYGTRAHCEALRRHGPTPLHRFSFAPVAQAALL